MQHLGVEYRGTPEALVTAGLAIAEWLPGQPGCSNVVSLSIVIDGRRAYFSRNVKQEYFAWYAWTLEEGESQQPSPDDEHSENVAIAAKAAKPDDCPVIRPTHPNLATEGQWPPDIPHRSTIKRGNGARWHFRGSADAFKSVGLLLPEEIPGDPECKRQGYYFGWHNGVPISATRLGHDVALTLLAEGSSIIKLVPRRLGEDRT